MIASSDRVQQLQRLLVDQKLDAYVVPSADPHQSEYVAESWKRRQYISGFTGSAGLFACTQKKAGLWTDGRYFVQAESELHDTGIELFRQGQPGVPDWKSWIVSELPQGGRLGINLQLFSIEALATLETATAAAGVELVPQELDLVDRVWSEARPAAVQAPLRLHPLPYAGVAPASKLERLRAAMQEAGVGSIIISALDEIAWLFNLRGADVEFNPVFYSYALINTSEAKLFVHPSQVTSEVRSALKGEVQFEAYDDIWPWLRDRPFSGAVWLDPSSSSAAVARILRERGIPVTSKPTPVAGWKAIKSPQELAGMRRAHVRDGAAVFRFLRWLQSALASGRPLTEMSVAEQLEIFRQLAPDYIGPSFATISGFEAHAALPHYRATTASNASLQAPGIYLVDSGGQYRDGTTDITRTLALGTPSPEARRIYTTVLKGHLLLGRSLFPAGVNGYQLDVLARQPIWAEQLEYNHGTGHGVGAALCVHEGPFSVSQRNNTVPLQAGHILSNEPGCYLVGQFGVRIENLVEVVVRGSKGAFGTFLGFSDLTMCPYDRSLIDTELLSPVDIEQIDAYHARVYQSLAPLLEPNERSDLMRATATILP